MAVVNAKKQVQFRGGVPHNWHGVILWEISAGKARGKYNGYEAYNDKYHFRLRKDSCAECVHETGLILEGWETTSPESIRAISDDLVFRGASQSEMLAAMVVLIKENSPPWIFEDIGESEKQRLKKRWQKWAAESCNMVEEDYNHANRC